jgi:hypothetical protein
MKETGTCEPNTPKYREIRKNVPKMQDIPFKPYNKTAYLHTTIQKYIQSPFHDYSTNYTTKNMFNSNANLVATSNRSSRVH